MAKNRFTVNDVLNMLEDEIDFEQADIYITPPEQHDKSDEDSGDEDEGGTINNLTGNQLRASGVATVRGRDGREIIGQESEEENGLSSSEDFNESSESEDNLPLIQIAQRRPAARQRPRAQERRWIKQDIPQHRLQRFNWNVNKPAFLNKEWDPVTLFEQFFDDDVISLICEESILYARQSGNHTFQLSGNEVRLFLAILLVTGYNVLPRRRMHWEQSSDVRNEAIANAISRNRFEEILRYLHVCDNNTIDPCDRMAKIRPLFSMINERCLQHFPMEKDLCVDESMIPYSGRHGAKQFIRGKPIRFGFKLWCLNTRLGYLVQFEPYQGRGTGAGDLGLGANVVLDLIAELPELPYKLYFDNLFTSIKLLDRLTEKGLGGTGTIRSNRIEKCPIQPSKILSKQPRGTYDFKYDRNGGTLITEWNDNNVVYMATNCTTIEPENRVRRWSKAQSRHIEIPQPNMIKEYNTNMGGVDRMDQNVNTYRISIRCKKWWWALFAFIPDMVVQNCWILYRMTPTHQEKPLDLLEFRRNICNIYLMRFSQRAAMGRPMGRFPVLDKRVPTAVRTDGLNHMIQLNETQRRCAYCGGKSTRICVKCGVGIHDRCFFDFHSR